MKEELLFKTIVGSTAYGTNIQGSDIDHKGIYMQSHYDLLTNNYKPQIEVGKDECYYEVQRFLELLGSANPTVLEMLYMPDDCVLATSKQFDLIRSQREMFLTKKCKNSFGGYAVQQIQKARGLNKKMNWEKESMVRKTPLDFCFIFTGESRAQNLRDFLAKEFIEQEYCALVPVDHIRDGYILYYDKKGATRLFEPKGYKGIELADSNAVRISSVPKGETPLAFVHYNKDGYTQHCNAYKSYDTWLKERNTQRYIDIEGHGQQIDGKNMLHCRRLLDMAMEIARDGILTVRRPNAQELIDIRKGKVKLEYILAQAEEDILKMDELFATSNLPDSVDILAVQKLLGDVRYL